MKGIFFMCFKSNEGISERACHTLCIWRTGALAVFHLDGVSSIVALRREKIGDLSKLLNPSPLWILDIFRLGREGALTTKINY